jgi:hypothetical protein
LADTIIKVPTAKRHVIKINDMAAFKNQYKTKNVIKSNQLLTTSTKAIAVFCNEYIPDHFPDKVYVNYILTVNGIDYEIIPINISRDGKKIIKTSEYQLDSDSTIYINEEIKTAYLTIIINTPTVNETPFISNIKILTGGADSV